MKKFKTIYGAQTANRFEENILLARDRRFLPTSLEQNLSYGYIQEYTDIRFPSASRM